LFNSCCPRLAGWVRRLIDDDDTAHEIASEAFTRLLARWHKLDNPQGYLYRIAANLVSDHWRKGGRERRAIIERDLVPRDASRPAEGPMAAELALEGRDGTGAPAHVWETVGGGAWRVSLRLAGSRAAAATLLVYLTKR